ncbi:MAG: winged helix-turn-helix transcriptional regulator [Candidatus Micrarchaeota archaeon]|nr:winged helix-turn-helix transcriptional regulator [Candidatus Micrarchaeota archaeon]
MDKLISDLDIRFTLELDLNRLGLQTHSLLIKFRKKPGPELLSDVFGNKRNALCVFMAEGSFDLAVLVASQDPVKYAYWENVTTGRLSDYGVWIRPSSISFLHFGFIPVDSQLIEELNGILDAKDLDLLKALNANSRLSYAELARRTGMNEDTIRYRLFTLKKSGIIKRFTIAIQKPPHQYILAFSEDFSYMRHHERDASLARNWMMDSDKSMPLLTTFQFVGSLTGSYSNFIMALFGSRKEAMEKVIRRHKILYRGEELELKYARITGVLKGLLPFRNLEVRPNYKVVRWE